VEKKKGRKSGPHGEGKSGYKEKKSGRCGGNTGKGGEPRCEPRPKRINPPLRHRITKGKRRAGTVNAGSEKGPSQFCLKIRKKIPPQKRGRALKKGKSLSPISRGGVASISLIREGGRKGLGGGSVCLSKSQPTVDPSLSGKKKYLRKPVPGKEKTVCGKAKKGAAPAKGKKDLKAPYPLCFKGENNSSQPGGRGGSSTRSLGKLKKSSSSTPLRGKRSKSQVPTMIGKREKGSVF